MARYGEIVAGLRERFEADESRSTIGRMREIYPVLREMQVGGMKSVAIVQALNDMGFAQRELSVRVFDVYMHRIKKEEQKREALEAFASNASGKAKPKARNFAKEHLDSEASNPADSESLATLTRKQKGELAAKRYVRDEVNPLLKKKT